MNITNSLWSVYYIPLEEELIMKGALIVFEGIDGSGKATQSSLLTKKLKQEGKSVMHISFPDYASPASSLVKMYLNGDFGSKPTDVNPHAASLLYALYL